MAKTHLKLLLPSLVLAAAGTAGADGLRTTINVNADFGDIPNWADASMCVDLRSADDDCQTYHKAADYQFNDPDCRVKPYDLTNPPDSSVDVADYTASVAEFWAAVAAAKADNPSILIGTYLSGQRVQPRWRNYPIDGIDRSLLVNHPLFSSDWLDEVFDAHRLAQECTQTTQCGAGETCVSGSCLQDCTVDEDCNREGEQCEPYSCGTNCTDHACFLELEYDNVNIEIEAARDAFVDQIIAENQNRNQRAAAQQNPAVSLDILYLDNIVHPSSLSGTYDWDDRIDLLSRVKTEVNNAGQMVIANVALNQAHLLDPQAGGDWANDIGQLAGAVDGITLEIPYHPNARADGQKTQDTIDVYRAFLDADNSDGIPQRLIFIGLGANEADRIVQRRFLAGFAMCFYEPGDLLFVTGPPNQVWDSWTTQYGAPLGGADLTNFPIITRQFQNATLAVHADTRTVVWTEVSEHLPTIVAAYDGEGEPTLSFDYTVDTTTLGTPERPSVILRTPRQDWRIWSVDIDNDDDVGDIGSIMVEPNKDFGVRLLRDDDGPGARELMAINLDPQNADNYTNLFAANVTDEVMAGITVNADDQDNGGELENLTIGAITGDINARVINNVILGDAIGDIDVGQATGELIISDFYGTLNIEQSSAEIQFLNLNAALEIDELQENGVYVLNDTAGLVIINDMAAGTYATFGTVPGASGVFGSSLFYFYTDVPQGATVSFNADLSAETVIEIGDIAGTLAIHSGGGATITGENISGDVIMGSEGHEFSGSATFRELASGGSLSTLDDTDFGGDLHFVGEVKAGAAITIGGDLTSTGSITATSADNITATGEINGDLSIGGTFYGLLCAVNLAGDKPLPPNIDPGTIDLTSSVAKAPDCTNATTAADCASIPTQPDPEPANWRKNRFISFVPGNSGQEYAIAVNLASLHHPVGDVPYNPQDFTAYEEVELRWVNTLEDSAGNPVFVCPDSRAGSTFFKCATLGCAPQYEDWGAPLPGGDTVLHVTGAEIVPDSFYNIHLIYESCSPPPNWAAFSSGIVVGTNRFGNTRGVPDVAANAIDVGRIVDKTKDRVVAWTEPQCMLRQIKPQPYLNAINAEDIGLCVNAAKGLRYPLSMSGCASAVLCSATSCLEGGFPDITMCESGQTCVDGYCRDECKRCAIAE